MVKTAISFLFGCCLLLQLPDLPSVYYLWSVLPCLYLLLFAKTRFIAITVLGALWSLFYSHLIINDQLPADYIGKELTITGEISSIPQRLNRKISFEFTPNSNANYTLPSTLRLSWYPPLPEQFNAGEQWQLTVKLKPAHGLSNPGTFDYEKWLFEQNIGAIGYVRTHASNQKLANASIFSINALRQKLNTFIDHSIPNSHNIGLIQALTTGSKHKIKPEQWQTLRQTGTNHLLAISGLHIGLAAAIGFFLFGKIWSIRAKNLLLIPANEVAAVAGFFTALLYAAMAGFAIPTQRALIMIATIMLMLFFRKPIASPQVLASSLLLLLIYDPLTVLSIGFWLSFCAVAIILYVSQQRYPSPRLQWLKIHALIAFGLSPILLLFFSQTSLIAPVANSIAVPFISFIIVPMLLLATVLSAIVEPMASQLFLWSANLIELSWPLLDSLAALPFSHWSGPSLPTPYWLLAIMGSFLLLSAHKLPAKGLATLTFVPLFLFKVETPKQGEFWFTLLDVGQGLSAVVQTQHHSLVFDTGPQFSEQFNTGSAVVLPYLKRQQISQLDTLIISHGDNDHIGGASTVINAIPIITLLSSVPEQLNNAQACIAGQSWLWDEVQFTILNPAPNDSGSENNRSCVLKISVGDHSVLIAADIEKEVEQALIERYPSILKSTILVAPHHGSKTSSTPNFIDNVQANIVLFPIGYMNRYHFPSDEVINRYLKNHSQTANTATHGAISFKITADKISPMRTWRQYARKIWTHQATD